MKKKEPVIKTKRIIIQPMSDREIENLIATADSDELRKAYEEMLSGCKQNPDNRIWYAPWKMVLRSDHTCIGELGFKGISHGCAVEIGYGILPEYEGNGFTTEAVQAMTQWALANPDVIFVEAETETDNKGSQRVLEKCGFMPAGHGKEGPRFIKEKALTSWMLVYMLFGISIGTSLGVSYGNTGAGISIGLCIGICIGAVFDSSARKKREKLRKQITVDNGWKITD